jgi:endonuclease YncB( thermonuclease family)
MKRFLFVFAALSMFCNPVKANTFDQEYLSVNDAYILEKTDSSIYSLYDRYLFVGYFLGMRDFFSSLVLPFDEKKSKCIARPLGVWEDVIFDQYKVNKISGKDYFSIIFLKTIREVCDIDLPELIKNEPTKPIPMPSSSYKVSEVTDGDTVKIIKNDEIIKVRLADIDCFETSANPRGKWQAEHYNKTIDEVIKLGKQSKEILQDFVNQQADGKVVLVDRGKDKYKRTLGVLYIDGVNVNDYMLQYGKCEKYMPRKPLQSLM